MSEKEIDPEQLEMIYHLLALIVVVPLFVFPLIMTCVCSPFIMGYSFGKWWTRFKSYRSAKSNGKNNTGSEPKKSCTSGNENNTAPNPVPTTPSGLELARWGDICAASCLALALAMVFFYFKFDCTDEDLLSLKHGLCAFWNTALVGLYLRKYVPTVLLKLRRKHGDKYQEICQNIIDYPMHRDLDAAYELENIGICSFAQHVLVAGLFVIFSMLLNFWLTPMILCIDFLEKQKILQRALRYYVESLHPTNVQPNSIIEELKKACDYPPVNSPVADLADSATDGTNCVKYRPSGDNIIQQ
jgi:hypothetical protein